MKRHISETEQLGWAALAAAVLALLVAFLAGMVLR